MAYIVLFFFLGLFVNLSQATEHALLSAEKKRKPYHFEIVPLRRIEYNGEKASSLLDEAIEQLEKKIFDKGLPLYMTFAKSFDQLVQERQSFMSSDEALEKDLKYGTSVVSKEQIDAIKPLVTFIDYQYLNTAFYTALANLKQEPFCVNQEPYWVAGGVGKSSHWLASVAVATGFSHALPVGFIECSEWILNVEKIFGQEFFDDAKMSLDSFNIIMIDDIHYSGSQMDDMIRQVLKKFYSDYKLSLHKKSKQDASKISINFFIYGLLMHAKAIERIEKSYGYDTNDNLALALTHHNIDVCITVKYHQKNGLLCADTLLNKGIFTKKDFLNLDFDEKQALTVTEWKSTDSRSTSFMLPFICGIKTPDETQKPYYLDPKTTADLQKKASLRG